MSSRTIPAGALLLALLAGCTAGPGPAPEPAFPPGGELPPPPPAPLEQQLGVRIPPGYNYAEETTAGTARFVAEADGRSMILIPAGDGVGPFLIDEFEVTNGDYRRFARRTGAPFPSDPTNPAWELVYFRPYPNFPLDHATWFMAGAYSSWVGRALPTEQEWRRAALGGGTPGWSDGAVNCLETDSRTPVPPGSFPADISGFGVVDLAANVDEWTVSPGAGPGERRIMGGYWGTPREELQSVCTRGRSAPAGEALHGFRTVLRLEPLSGR